MFGHLFKKAAPLSQADRWAVALCAMYSHQHGTPHDRLAPFGLLFLPMSWIMLRKDWGVDGTTRRKKAKQSREVLDHLRHRGHREKLAEPNDQEAFLDLFAWDAARLVFVARHMFHAGFLSEAETWSYIRPMARETQPLYPSWADYGRRYLRGLSRWRTEPDKTYEEAISELLEDANSPWRQLAWTTPLGAAEPS